MWGFIMLNFFQRFKRNYSNSWAEISVAYWLIHGNEMRKDNFEDLYDFQINALDAHNKAKRAARSLSSAAHKQGRTPNQRDFLAKNLWATSLVTAHNLVTDVYGKQKMFTPEQDQLMEEALCLVVEHAFQNHVDGIRYTVNLFQNTDTVVTALNRNGSPPIQEIKLGNLNEFADANLQF